IAGGAVLLDFCVVFFIAMTELDAVTPADLGEVGVKALAIPIAGVMTVPVRCVITRCELWKLLFDERQVSLTRRGTQSQRACVEIRGSRGRHRPNQRLELVRTVGDARQDGHHVDAGLDSVLAKPRERAQARLGRRSAR